MYLVVNIVGSLILQLHVSVAQPIASLTLFLTNEIPARPIPPNLYPLPLCFRNILMLGERS